METEFKSIFISLQTYSGTHVHENSSELHEKNENVYYDKNIVI